MGRPVRYWLVAADALPDALLKVAEAKRLLRTGEAKTVGRAVDMAGISRSAFYKYRDAIWPFQDLRAERIVTFQGRLRDAPGVLSRVLAVFASAGADILTIDQSIPIDGCAAVTICAEASSVPLEELLEEVSGAEGVLKFEILAG